MQHFLLNSSLKRHTIKKVEARKEIQQLVYNVEVLICFSTTERQGDGKL
jgi:hypothetical protein